MSFVFIHSVLRMSTIVLVMVWGGCGASVSDETNASPAQPAAAVRQIDIDVRTVTSAAAGKNGVEVEANTGEAVYQSADGEVSPEIAIPRSILIDLTSLEARTRLHALEHWEKNDRNAPLDAVFDALEDEDEAVRAKAEAIVEQRWEAEQERERS